MRALGLGLSFNKLRALGVKFIANFGDNLAAAYFLKDLGSKRGAVDGAVDPVVRIRRDDGGLRAFTASDISGGAALSYVNHDTTAQYNNSMYFNKNAFVTFSLFDYASSTLTMDFLYLEDANQQFLAIGDGDNYNLSATLNSSAGGGSNDFVIQSDNSRDGRDGSIYRANGLVVGTTYALSATFNATNQLTAVTLNGTSATTAGTGSGRLNTGCTCALLGIRDDGNFQYHGVIRNFAICIMYPQCCSWRMKKERLSRKISAFNVQEGNLS